MNFDYNFPLPYETLLHVFSFLEEKDRVVKSRTCRAFYKVSHDACFLRTFGPGLIEALGGREAVQKLPKKSVDHWDDLKNITVAGIPHPIMRAHFVALNVDVLFIRFNNRHAQKSPDVALFFGSHPNNWQPFGHPKIFVTKPSSYFFPTDDTLGQNIDIIKRLVHGQDVGGIAYGYPTPVPQTFGEEEWSYMESAWRETEPKRDQNGSIVRLCLDDTIHLAICPKATVDI